MEFDQLISDALEHSLVHIANVRAAMNNPNLRPTADIVRGWSTDLANVIASLKEQVFLLRGRKTMLLNIPKEIRK